MLPLNTNKNIIDKKNQPRVSRREFLKLSLLASAGLGLSLSGCTPATGQGATSEEPLAVIEEWIKAVNEEDASSFERLHSDTVFATAHFKKNHYYGRENVWELYRTSTGSQIKKITSFGQDEWVCLMANATRFNRSLCYVFEIVEGMIESVYEYDSGRYNLSNYPEFVEINTVTDDAGLQDRLDAMDSMFVDGANNRDFSAPHLKESAVYFTPTSPSPLTNKEQIIKDGEAYTSFWPSVIHKKIQTFGQGNLICTHVMVEGAPKGSLCWVAEFQEDKITEVYEFWSEAEIPS